MIGGNEMTVELIGVVNPENRILKELPALLPSDSAEPAHEGLPDASFRCLIGQVDGHLEVWDLGARGGTFVNGVPVKKAVLRTSDTLRLGGQEFSVRCDHGPRRYVFGVRC
jgi:hypothetical protein